MLTTVVTTGHVLEHIRNKVQEYLTVKLLLNVIQMLYNTYSLSQRRPVVPSAQVQVLCGPHVAPCRQGGTQGVVTTADTPSESVRRKVLQPDICKHTTDLFHRGCRWILGNSDTCWGPRTRRRSCKASDTRQVLMETEEEGSPKSFNPTQMIGTHFVTVVWRQTCGTLLATKSKHWCGSKSYNSSKKDGGTTR